MGNPNTKTPAENVKCPIPDISQAHKPRNVIQTSALRIAEPRRGGALNSHQPSRTGPRGDCSRAAASSTPKIRPRTNQQHRIPSACEQSRSRAKFSNVASHQADAQNASARRLTWGEHSAPTLDANLDQLIESCVALGCSIMESKVTQRDGTTGANGTAALSICESLLVALTDLKIISEQDARDLLTDVATTHDEAASFSRTPDKHRAIVAIVHRILDGTFASSPGPNSHPLAGPRLSQVSGRSSPSAGRFPSRGSSQTLSGASRRIFHWWINLNAHR